MKFQLTLTLICLFFLTNCSRLPTKKLSQSGGNIVEYSVDNDSLKIEINNPLKCPIRVSANSPEEVIQEKIANSFPVTIDPHKNVLLTYWTNKSKDEIQIEFSAMMGDPNNSIHKKRYESSL